MLIDVIEYRALSINDLRAPDRMNLTVQEQARLIKVARDSIAYGVDYGKPLHIDVEAFPEICRQETATFVTLKRNGSLRGCIGAIDPCRPLVTDISHNAFAAAFRDSRFTAVELHELPQLDLFISILTPRTYIEFTSQDDLLSKVRPGIDGLVLQEGPYCGAFLPVMWDTFEDAETFFAHLKTKAGLPRNYWSDSVIVSRFTTALYLKSEASSPAPA